MGIRLTALAWTASMVALWSESGPWSAALFSVAVSCWAMALYCSPSDSSATLTGDSAPDVETAGNDLRILRANLEQVRALVAETAETTSREFEQINREIRHQQALVRSMRAHDVRDGDAAELETVTTAIDKRIAGMIVSMQFGDIVNQLLEYTDQQLSEVENCLHENGRLELSDGAKPTSQTSMKAGELELF